MNPILKMRAIISNQDANYVYNYKYPNEAVGPNLSKYLGDNLLSSKEDNMKLADKKLVDKKPVDEKPVDKELVDEKLVDKIKELNTYILDNGLYKSLNDWNTWEKIMKTTIINYRLAPYNDLGEDDIIYRNAKFHIFNNQIIDRVITCTNLCYDLQMELPKKGSKKKQVIPGFGPRQLWFSRHYKLLNDIKIKLTDNDYDEDNPYTPYLNFYYIEKMKIDDENPQIYIIGDIHSSFHSLYKVLLDIRRKYDAFCYEYNLNEEKYEFSLKLKEHHYIFFTGDIVDRGPYGLECLVLVCMLKIINPYNVFICDGNHENPDTFYRYGFLD